MERQDIIHINVDNVLAGFKFLRDLVDPLLAVAVKIEGIPGLSRLLVTHQMYDPNAVKLGKIGQIEAC